MKNWDAEYYDKNSFMQYKIASMMLDTLQLEGSEIILDVGSGSGKISYEIAKKVPKGRVIGLDASDSMVLFSRENYKADNLFFKKEDVVNMTHQNFFDVVVSFWTLSWVANQRMALMNIVRSLQSNGRMLLMYPMRHDVYDVIDQVIKRSEWKKYFQEFTNPRLFVSEDKYRCILQELKLKALNINRKKLECKFADKEEMVGSIRSWLPYLSQIQDQNAQRVFLETIVDEYLNFKRSEVYIMHFNILEISGVKF